MRYSNKYWRVHKSMFLRIPFIGSIKTSLRLEPPKRASGENWLTANKVLNLKKINYLKCIDFRFYLSSKDAKETGKYVSKTVFNPQSKFDSRINN